jgi:type I restriction enzyme M protein
MGASLLSSLTILNMAYAQWTNEASPSLAQLLVRLATPIKGLFLDPCCGSGAILQAAYDLRDAHDGIYLHGLEFNDEAWSLCKARMNSLHPSPNIGTGPVRQFEADIPQDFKADYIATCAVEWNQPGVLSPELWQVEGVSLQSAPIETPLAWLVYCLQRLAQTGVAVVALPTGTLYRRKSVEVEIRSRLVDAGLVECIILLPSGMLPWGQLPICVWVLRRSPANSVAPHPYSLKTLLIDAVSLGAWRSGAGPKQLSAEDVSLITSTYQSFRATGDGVFPENTSVKISVVDHKDFRLSGYNLNPRSY